MLSKKNWACPKFWTPFKVQMGGVQGFYGGWSLIAGRAVELDTIVKHFDIIKCGRDSRRTGGGFWGSIN
jgi:hypothetical protein